jgi:hypothetical protein
VEVLSDIIQSLRARGPEIATGLAALTTIVGALLGYFFAYEGRRVIPKLVSMEEEDTKKASLPMQSRLFDARAALEQQEKVEQWSRRANGYLRFGQYIIGGVLATSLVQSNLSAVIVSILGVLVLVSSLVHQHYRPDLRFHGAKRRTVQLRALIRDVEDALYEIEQQRPGASSIFDVRKIVSRALSQIEASEASEYEPRRSEESDAQPRATPDGNRASHGSAGEL